MAVLVTATETLDSSKFGTKEWFDQVLHNKIKEYSNACGYPIVDSQDCDDVKFAYVRTCVNALMNLKIELSKALEDQVNEKIANPTNVPRLDADALSIAQQKNVHALVQMIVCLGILPNLIPGIGLPIEKRSEFFKFVVADSVKVSIFEKYKRLLYSVESLLELSKYKSLNAIVMTKHMGDILAAILQIAYAPIKKPSKDSTPPKEIDTKQEEFIMTDEIYERLAQNQEKYKKVLEKIIEKTYQPLIVKYFLILQTGSADKTIKTPTWLTKIVGELLTSRLLAPNGVMHVMRGVLDLGGGDPTSMDWKKFGLVASVLASPPSSSYANQEAYYAAICPQLLELLNHDEKVYQMMACSAIRAVTERSIILSRRYLLDVLMKPLISLCDGEDVNEALSITEEGLDDCIKSLYKVFVIGNDPSIMFLNHLEVVIMVLLHLHMRITFGVSHLKNPISEIINRFLKHEDKTTALMVLRAFAFKSLPVERKNRIRLMNPNLDFGTGEDGGVKVVKFDLEEQSFYVSDDEKSIVVQDLLEDIKDRQMSVDFFLSLINDLNDVMVEDDELGDDPELPEAKEGTNLEQQLLDLEANLDTSMNKMRKNLMVIRLLGLLSEDDKLQENLMDESSKLIQFLTSSLKRGAMLLTKQKENINNEDGGRPGGIMAVQSLNMALSILCVHLTRRTVTVEDWNQVQAVVDDLEVLKLHDDPRISKMSGQLQQLILTHGVILDQTKAMKERTVKIKAETEQMNQKIKEIKAIGKKMEDEKMDENKEKLNKKIEEANKAKENRAKKDIPEASSAAVDENEDMSEYKLALFDLSDPLLPVRGHGIIELTRLIENHDVETILNIDKVSQVLVDSLEDEDTYIYCSAINGLVSCARYDTDLALDTLTKEFCLLPQRKNMEDKSVEIRLKIGEALVRVTRELGEITPKYKNLLLNTLCSAANDPEPLVRSSSISNLGEVCKNLKFSLGGIAGEVLQHLEMSSRDQDITVRRAAVMAVALILQGLGRDAFRVLDANLKDLYRGLKTLARIETDEVTLTHASIAMEEIDNIIKEFLAPTEVLEKKIYVLDSPPEPF